MLLPTVYEDAGLSGGTLERPGLQRLLTDIDAGLVEQIVVYKVDRLTRSLSDFAKLVERLAAAGAVFVSVTQSFNTATSMGRLTLHMLLSFAQFEREVTAERIRDKVAASKCKGLWMGGRVPLGYEKDERTLRINEAEAETVRTLYALYRQHGTLRQVKAEADRLGLRTKRRFAADGTRTGGLPFRRGHLHCLLTNPLYAGRIPAPEACLRGPASIDHCSGVLGRGPGAATGRGCQTKETHDEGPCSPFPTGRQALRILTPRRSSRQSVKLTQNRSPDSPPIIASRTNGTGERQEGRAEFWHRTGLAPTTAVPRDPTPHGFQGYHAHELGSHARPYRCSGPPGFGYQRRTMRGCLQLPPFHVGTSLPGVVNGENDSVRKIGAACTERR